MPKLNHQVEVNVPIHSVWDFVSNMDNWASLIPGYIGHSVINDKESTWCFKSNIGILKKKIEFKIDITSWQEPTKVAFNLTGLNEKFSGRGVFTLESEGPNKCLLIGFLDVTAEGMLAKVGKAILGSSLPEMTTELNEVVSTTIEDYYLQKMK